MNPFEQAEQFRNKINTKNAPVPGEQNKPASNGTDMQALHLTHAIALAESDDGTGKPNYNAVGDNGTSHGAYQWQPGNYEVAAKKYGFDPNDRSPTTQDKVAYAQVKEYKDQGLRPDQIAAAWNAGYGHINDWQNHRGTTVINGKPLEYDTPAYVGKVKNYYQKLSAEPSQSQQTEDGEKKPTLGGQIVRGILRPFVRAINTPIEGIKLLAGQNPDQAAGTSKYLGDISGFGMKKGQTAGQRVEDIAGGILELGSYLIGAGEIGAGIKTLGVGEKLVPGLVKTGIAGGLSGAGAGAGQEMQEGGNFGQVATQGIIGGVTGGALGLGGGLLGKTAGLLSEHLSSKIGPETASFVHNKAVKDIISTLESSERGSDFIDKAENAKTVDAMMKSGYFPEIKENKRMDFRKSTEKINKDIKQGQQEFQTRLEQNGKTASLDALRSSALERVAKDISDVRELPRIQEKINSEYDQLAKDIKEGKIHIKDMDNLSAKDIDAIQTSFQSDVKWANPNILGATKENTILGKAAKSAYRSINDYLYALDPELAKINMRQTALHRIRDLMGEKGLQNKKIIPADTRNWFTKIGAGLSEKIIGKNATETFGTQLGLEPETILGSKTAKKVASQLQEGMSLKDFKGKTKGSTAVGAGLLNTSQATRKRLVK